MLEELHRWQELAGAIMGGAFALLVALIVARDARFRAERAAAMMVIAALLRMRASYQGAYRAITKKVQNSDDAAFGLAAIFSMQPPLPPESFSQSAAILLHVHTHVAAHLSIIETVLVDVRRAVDRWAREQEEYARGTARLGGINVGEFDDDDLPRAKGDMLIDARTIQRGMKALGEHSNCVVHLLEMLVLSRFPSFQRMRLWLKPDKIERVCAEALSTGEFPAEKSAAP